MGIYDSTYVYYGRMLRPETKARLPPEAKPFLTDMGTHWMLAAPSRRVSCTPYRVIEGRPIARLENIAWADVERALSRDKLERWNSAPESELAELERLVAIAGAAEKPGVYVASVSWSTYSLEDDSTLDRNVRVD
jgi:hypothetical protein